MAVNRHGWWGYFLVAAASESASGVERDGRAQRELITKRSSKQRPRRHLRSQVLKVVRAAAARNQ
eukprot:9373121-Pyramimonas_sp.AAC.1